MLNYWYGISHGMTTVYTLHSLQLLIYMIQCQLVYNLIFFRFFYMFLIFCIEYLFLIIYKFPSAARVGVLLNTGARQGGSSLPVSAHARTLKFPPSLRPPTTSSKKIKKKSIGFFDQSSRHFRQF
jgi:hypothetical protein